MDVVRKSERERGERSEVEVGKWKGGEGSVEAGKGRGVGREREMYPNSVVAQKFQA